MAAGAVAAVPVSTLAQARPTPASRPRLTVYKSPSCTCCGQWVNYMEGLKYQASIMNLDSAALLATKKRYGVPANLQSCHTTLLAGLIIEGHVPEGDIVRLLKERPKGVVGLTIPGMPASAPGMDQRPFQPYDVLAFDKSGKTSLWARHTRPS